MKNDYCEMLRTVYGDDANEDTIRLIDCLEYAYDQHGEACIQDNEIEIAYWQGKKDGLRSALAIRLNAPEIANLNDNAGLRR